MIFFFDGEGESIVGDKKGGDDELFLNDFTGTIFNYGGFKRGAGGGDRFEETVHIVGELIKEWRKGLFHHPKDRITV